MTSRGQTLYPISTIFNRLRERTIDDMLTMNEDAALKTVDARLFTDRQTNKQIDRQTEEVSKTDGQRQNTDIYEGGGR